jgi:hypothetical protein
LPWHSFDPHRKISALSREEDFCRFAKYFIENFVECRIWGDCDTNFLSKIDASFTLKAEAKRIPDHDALQKAREDHLFLSIRDQQEDNYFERIMVGRTLYWTLNDVYVKAFAVSLCPKNDGKLDRHHLESCSSVCNVDSHGGVP